MPKETIVLVVSEAGWPGLLDEPVFQDWCLLFKSNSYFFRPTVVGALRVADLEASSVIVLAPELNEHVFAERVAELGGNLDALQHKVMCSGSKDGGVLTEAVILRADESHTKSDVLRLLLARCEKELKEKGAKNGT